MFFLSFTMHVLWLVDNMMCDCGSDALKYLVKFPRKSKLITGVLPAAMGSIALLIYFQRFQQLPPFVKERCSYSLYFSGVFCC